VCRGNYALNHSKLVFPLLGLIVVLQLNSHFFNFWVTWLEKWLIVWLNLHQILLYQPNKFDFVNKNNIISYSGSY